MISKLGLSERDRRTLIGGGGIVIALLVLARGIPELRRWEEARASEAESSATAVGEMRGGIAALAALRDSTHARTARLAALDSSLISGVSPAAVAAGLASMLGDLADDNAVKVNAMQLHSDSVVKAGLARADVRVTGVADVTGLAGFLRDIEGGPALLRIRELSISQPDPAGGNEKPEALRVDLVIEGLGTIVREDRR